MKHLDNGDLRRMLDEPQAFDDAARMHAQTCDECRARRALVAADASDAARRLGGDLQVDEARAYAAVHERIAERASPARWYSAAAAAALAAAFVAALLFSPLGTYARSFLTVFEPRQFAPIAVTSSQIRELRLMPQANDVGTQRVVLKPQRAQYASLASARGHVPYPVLAPAAVPAHLGSARSFSVVSPGEMTFTFNAAKARAFERRSHKRLPAMPPGLDGTMLRVRTGTVFNAHYGAKPEKTRGKAAFLEIVEAPVPRVTSTGASLQTLERYLLSMPNVSPELAGQIRMLGDIRTTVPVPVLADKQNAKRVSVQGVQGLAIGDNTGLGAGVIWEKNGMMYVVAGPLSMDEVLTVAHGLR